MANQTQDSTQNVRPGMYLLWAIDGTSFEQIRQDLNGDDYFLHDPSKYPHPRSHSPFGDKTVHIWVHYDENSRAYGILRNLSPLTTGISLKIDARGNHTSDYYYKAKFAGGKWRHDVLDQRVNLEKLTEDDIRLTGEFRIVDEIYHGWKMRPEFKQEGTDNYVPIDELFSEDKFHQCYELIVQTPDFTQVVGSGYLHSTHNGDVSFGIQSAGQGRERIYFNSLPVWFNLFDDSQKPIVEGLVDLLFVKISPMHDKIDAQRQRVL